MGARVAGAALSLSVRAWYETSYAYLGRRIQGIVRTGRFGVHKKLRQMLKRKRPVRVT
jgi:hypothetical protein